MPKPKTTRLQTRFDPNRGNRPPEPHEMIELVDPRWILKALALMLGLGVLCAVLTIAFFHHYQKLHTKPTPSSQTTSR
jgi:hypothetical protein